MLRVLGKIWQKSPELRLAFPTLYPKPNLNLLNQVLLAKLFLSVDSN